MFDRIVTKEVCRIGQRLVFEVKKDDETIATIFYNWSGYTMACYLEAQTIIRGLKERNYKPDTSKEESIAILLDILENNVQTYETPVARIERGGAANDSKDELDAISNKYRHKGLYKGTFSDMVSRNQGLISITDDGMSNALDFAEYVEEIDLTEQTFTHNIFVQFDADDGSFDEWLSEHYMTLDDIPDWNPPEEYTGVIQFDKCDEAVEWYRDWIKKNDKLRGGIVGKIKSITNSCELVSCVC